MWLRWSAWTVDPWNCVQRKSHPHRRDAILRWSQSQILTVTSIQQWIFHRIHLVSMTPSMRVSGREVQAIGSSELWLPKPNWRPRNWQERRITPNGKPSGRKRLDHWKICFDESMANSEQLLHYEGEIELVMSRLEKPHAKHTRLINYMKSHDWHRIKLEFGIPLMVWLLVAGPFQTVASKVIPYGEMKEAFARAYATINEVLTNDSFSQALRLIKINGPCKRSDRRCQIEWYEHAFTWRSYWKFHSDPLCYHFFASKQII